MKLQNCVIYGVILIYLTLTSIQCQILDGVFSDICITQETCRACISASPQCTWCSSDVYNSTWRCDIINRLKLNGCPENSIMKHVDGSVTKIQDTELTDVTENHINPVQIRPQEYYIELSPFETQSFTFQYRSAKNYPLDLYYLMDLTWTMKDDKQTLAALGKDLLDALEKMTTDFKIGFGSYAEKPLMPYTQMAPKLRANPCIGEEDSEICEPTTTYKHRLRITDNVTEFSNIIKNSKITGNLDNAEAGIDALMQVLVCNDKIGWRPTSRKIVIFATDSILHFAGDGILGGAPFPNDKKCHLDDDGNFIDNLHMDYPSLEEIYRELLKEKISVIFAVTEDVVPYYERMKKLLPENIFVAALTNDSSNILNLVKIGYESIISVINFEDDSNDFIKMQYFSNCGYENERAVANKRCDNIEVGKTYTFTINMTMNQCSRESKDMVKNITVSETQLGTDSFVIGTKLLCNCDCKKMATDNPKNCPSNSMENCGVCECLDGWFGSKCDCNKTKESVFKVTENCRAPGDVQPCSGLGDCICDSCECDTGYEGKFCQCKSCPISSDNGQSCGGKSRGICNCGQCFCQEGWFGPTCSCSKKHCVAPWDNQTLECSGRGFCDCEQCRCKIIDGIQYVGKYCESCLNCKNPGCDEYKNCVRCLIEPESCNDTSCISQNGTLYQKCDEHKNECTTLEENYCEYVDKAECIHPFSYSIKKDWTVSLNIPERSCFVRAGFMDKLAGGLIILFILVIGMFVLLFWKCCDYFTSKREYAHFIRNLKEKEKAMDLAGLNPIYKSPVTDFVVPDAYKKKLEEDNQL